jgi:hypothetical protein
MTSTSRSELRPLPQEDDLIRCAKCSSLIGERVTAYGNLWLDLRGWSQCVKGGMHTPLTRSPGCRCP